MLKNNKFYEENVPYRVTIRTVNEKCKIMKLFRELEVHKFTVVDIRRLYTGVTRHLVRIPINYLNQIPKRSYARIRDSIKVGNEAAAWFETEGCELCNTIVSEGAFLITGWNTVEDEIAYTFIVPNIRVAQKIISILEKLRFDIEVLGMEKYKRKSPFLTKKQETTLWLALKEGFFDYPKKISITELSRKLEVSPSTLSEIMRRGIRRLLEYYFETF